MRIQIQYTHMLLLLTPIYRRYMSKIIHAIFTALIVIAIGVAGFLFGWNVRAYKANKGVKNETK